MALWKKILVILLLPAAAVLMPTVVGISVCLVAQWFGPEFKQGEFSLIFIVNFLLTLTLEGWIAGEVFKEKKE